MRDLPTNSPNADDFQNPSKSDAGDIFTLSRQEKIESADIVGRTLAFPDADQFDDLFTGILDYRKTFGRLVRSYCHWRRDPLPRSLDLEPAVAVVDYLHDSDVVDLSMYFQFTDRGNGYTLVSTTYDQIIGGRWLAFIRTDSIVAAVENARGEPLS